MLLNIWTCVIIYIFFFYIFYNKKESFLNYSFVSDKEQKVYISFTTIPSRIAYINEMLKSVDVPEVYEIHLNLQSELEYPEKEIERLKSMTPKLKVFWSTGKYIIMSKSIPTLERLLGTNALVLVVDDDMEYSRDYIKEFINNYNPNIREILGGKILYPGNHSCGIDQFPPGLYGILYPMKIITKEIVDDMILSGKLSNSCYKAEDVATTAILKKHGISLRKANEKMPEIKELNYSLVDAVRLFTHPPEYESGYAYNDIQCCSKLHKYLFKDSFENDTQNADTQNTETQNTDINKVNINKVYISFTTIPSRISHINEMLKSVDIPDVHEIHLNLQNEFEYPEKEIERLKSITPKLKIYKVDEKIGPISKVIPTIERLLGTNSLVISVDDDGIYPINVIKNLIDSYDPKVDEIICNTLFSVAEKECRHKYTYGGGVGVLYPTKIFNINMINEMKKIATSSNYCYKTDDTVLNIVLNKYNVKLRKIATPNPYVKFLEYSTKNALHLTSHPPGYYNGNIYNTVMCCTHVYNDTS